jgi:hypothetical protein
MIWMTVAKVQNLISVIYSFILKGGEMNNGYVDDVIDAVQETVAKVSAARMTPGMRRNETTRFPLRYVLFIHHFDRLLL